VAVPQTLVSKHSDLNAASDPRRNGMWVANKTTVVSRHTGGYLEFSSQAWSPRLQKDVEVLERVQKMAVSMVNGLNGTYLDKLAQLGMQTLTQRRNEADLVLVYKIIHKNVM
jgi:hypothetical protein